MPDWADEANAVNGRLVIGVGIGLGRRIRLGGRIILAGLMHYNKASVLVFDMHNEYGLDDVASDSRETVTGLRTKFGTKVQVIGLGSGATIRGQTPDFNLEIPTNEIQPQDIEMLTRELNLKDVSVRLPRE